MLLRHFTIQVNILVTFYLPEKERYQISHLRYQFIFVFEYFIFQIVACQLTHFFLEKPCVPTTLLWEYLGPYFFSLRVISCCDVISPPLQMIPHSLYVAHFYQNKKIVKKMEKCGLIQELVFNFNGLVTSM